MIEIDLLEAKARKRRVHLGVSLGLLATCFLGVFLFEFSSSETPENTKSTSLEEEVVLKPSPESISQKNEQRVEAADLDISAAPLRQAEPEVDQSAFKERFFEALKDYKQDVQPRLAKFESLVSNRELNDQTQAREREASSKAVRKLFQDGYKILTALNQFVSDKIDVEEVKLTKLIDKFQKAWVVKDINLVVAAIEAARLVSPENSEIFHFSRLVKDWPEVSRFLDNASLSENRGDIDQAIDSLRAIRNLAHDIPDLESRISSLQLKQKDLVESKLIENLFNALESSDLVGASTAINALKDEGVSELNYAQLLEEYKNKKYDANLMRVNEALDESIVRDDWIKAKKIADQNKNIFASEPRFRARLEVIQRIFDGLTNVNRVLSQSDSLLSERVRSDVHKMLKNIELDLNMSATLKIRAAELDKLLSQYGTKVPITIASDGLTYIEVKSVGQVGEIASKVIQLLPGKYTLIGKRMGYVTKQIELDVRPISPTRITVVADEPI